MGIKVALRQKSISKGRKSLYLDFYPPITHQKTGKPTRREFLSIYILDKPKNSLERLDKKQTLMLAEQIRQKRENELNKPEIYTEFEKEQLRLKEIGQRSFLKYYEKQMDKKKGANYNVWEASFFYLNDYSNGELKFSNLNESFCNGYREYLLTAKSRRRKEQIIKQNTAQSYFNKFKATLKQAFKDELLSFDLNSKIERIKDAETKKEHLSIEELNILAKTKCENSLLKQAAIFSALTGLRFSDVKKLLWREIIETEGNYSIQFQQQKTDGIEYLPIPGQAFELLGKVGNPDDEVFKGLKYSAHQNKILLKWVQDAGIKRHITFHCFRHTYATLQLTAGTNLYTVSKMLGHKNIKTTQVYAKIIDEKKREAANKIKLEL